MLESNKWSGGANYARGIDDEYYRTSGWSFERFLLFINHQHGHLTTVKAELRISEYKRRRNWSLRVSANHQRRRNYYIASGKTDSVASCLRQASTYIENHDVVLDALKEYYEEGNTELVYDNDNDGPVMCLFGDDIRTLTAGDYLIYKESSDSFRHAHIWGSGYSVGPVDQRWVPAWVWEKATSLSVHMELSTPKETFMTLSI